MGRVEKNKKILVFGAGGGVGFEICRIFDGNGWKVLKVSRNGGNCGVNVVNGEQREELFERVKGAVGGVDVMVNCIGLVKDYLILKMPESAWDEVVDMNLKLAYQLTQQFSPLLEENGGGHFVHIGSIVGAQGRQGQANYAAAKAGLVALAKSVAIELGPKNIRVNVIFPGFLQTAMTKDLSIEQQEKIRKENVLQKCGTVEEVGLFVHFLISTQHISGQVFNLDSRILAHSV